MNQSVLERKTVTTIPNSKQKTVLVVDDQPSILGLVRDILEHSGYATLAAESGEEALIVFDRREAPIDLVLTDVQMPRMDGLELARRFAERAPGLPIVFMTGYSAYREFQNALADHRSEAGHTVVRKPFRAEELVNRVGKMIDRSCAEPSGQLSMDAFAFHR